MTAPAASDPVPTRGRIALVRHGETTWSLSGQHTSVTDLELTDTGLAQARRVPGILSELGINPTAVYSSPRLRARHTAEAAGLGEPVQLADLAEWNYGEFEGLTTPQIHVDHPGWVFTDGAPGGESAKQVRDRADRVLRFVAEESTGDVVLVGHGHFSRVLAARWIRLRVVKAGLLSMDPAHVTVLGWYHGGPSLSQLNVPPLPLEHLPR